MSGVLADVGTSWHGPDDRPGVVHLDAAEVASRDREEFIRVAVAQGINPVELSYPSDDSGPIDMRLDSAALGPMSVQSLHMSAVAARRTARLARDDSPPSLFVILKQAGTSRVTQDGRESLVRPGQIVLLNSAHPSFVLDDGPSHRVNLQIPVPLLALPEPVLRRALALDLGPDLPLAAIVARFVESLTAVSDVRLGEADHLARAAVDLIRGLITTVLDETQGARDSLESSLALRVKDYLHTHWREHDLCAEQIAAAHHISTRQLYRLLAEEHISLGNWLRERRLEASRDDLTRAGSAETIAGVGRRWGFPDATNFGRVFKAAYGMTPREWRQLHRQHPPAAGVAVLAPSVLL